MSSFQASKIKNTTSDTDIMSKTILGGQTNIILRKLANVNTKPCINYILTQTEWKLLDFKSPHPEDTNSKLQPLDSSFRL